MPPARNYTHVVKNETVQVNGILTPSSSMTTGTLTPKAEESDVALSDITEGNFGKLHDGLPCVHNDEDNFYQNNQDQVRNIRSSAPSFRTSRQPSRNRRSMDVTVEDLQIPGSSLQIVGEKVNLLVSAIEELRQLGLKELDTVLPELVLVGDQSAGKSSLMGAIAEITLPKGVGMCTRCPANIKTSPAETWSCTVSLHEYFCYDAVGRRPTITKAHFKKGLFPPWKENPEGLEVKHFATISDKRELDNVLKCAQVALRNPSMDPKSFVPGSGVNVTKAFDQGQTQEADYSPNLVAIEISGPGLASLSFFDLPGLFSHANVPEEKYLVTAFENLAKQYINHKNALVISAMAMDTDAGNSKTSAFVEECKAEARCVRVLTKPDRLQDGGDSILDFDKLLRGQAHFLPRGYFVTKQPGPKFKLRDGAEYHAQAREEEAAFFDEDPRWTTEWQEFRHRCGTDAFVKSISQMLANQIADSLGNIQEKINAQRKDVDLALSALPELPGSNVQHVVLDRLQKISNGVNNLLAGGPRSNGFLSSWSQLTYDFRNAIEAIKPKFSYKHDSDMALPEREYIDLLSDDDSPVTPTQNRKRAAGNIFSAPQGHQSKKVKPDPSSNRELSVPRSTQSQQSFTHQPKQTPNGTSGLQLQRSMVRQMPKIKPTVFDDYLQLGSGFMSIGDIRENIDRHHPPGFPGHIDHTVYEEICLLAVSQWNVLLVRLADQTFKMLRRSILEILDKFLGDYQQTQLFRSTKSLLNKFLDQHVSEQRHILQVLFELESNKMFTVSDGIFEMFKAEALKSLQDARKRHRQDCYLEMNLTSKITDPLKVSDEMLGADPFQKEVEVAAYVRGYYKTAGLRFCDTACQSIRGNLFDKVETKIIGTLERALELYGSDGEKNCRMLMDENPGEAKQRSELQLKKKKLIEAAAKFNRLVEEYNAEGPANNAHSRGSSDAYADHRNTAPQPAQYQPRSARLPSLPSNEIAIDVDKNAQRIPIE